MPSISFVEPDGTVHLVEAEVGASLMEAARLSSIPGVLAECGGACACATCHVYILPEWVDRIGAANSDEAEMLEFALNTRPNSRLSCQIKVSDDLDGLVVEVPEE
ncbi:MAG: 2Fe-2S iron-sulfur cluster-binding protein [Sphingomonadaceae bacterium]|nr:2Fe-2S iron-sulfur cluster-binding protein [Sphingomonadaceae bacterium]